MTSSDQSSTRSPKSTLTSIKEFHTETIENLFRFKNENLFTDISIYVEGVEFPCHKVILCAASTYFRAMFTCDLKESRLGKVYIENISPWTMKRLLDFIYTGKIDINNENVIDLFNAAVMFQLCHLAEKCTDYIQQHIDLTNCIEIQLFACVHQLKKLEEDTFNFILDNFMQLININSSITSLSTQKQDAKIINNLMLDENEDLNDNYSNFVRLNERTFTSLIKSDLLNVSREIYVYYAVNKWVEYNITINSKFDGVCIYENLFRYIRLNALSKQELEFLLNNDRFIKSSDLLFNRIKKELAKNYTYSSSSSSSSASSSPPPVDTLNSYIDNLTVTPCLTSQTSIANNFRPSTLPREYLCLLNSDHFEIYDFYKSKWDHLSSWPVCTTSDGQLQPCSNVLFGANTKNTDKIQKQRLNGYSVCVVDNILYVFGGHLINNASSFRSDSSKNLSSSESRSSSFESSPSVSLHESTESLFSTDHYLLNNIDLVDRVYKFDPIKNEWSTCKSMLRERAFHLSLSLNSKSNDNYIFLFYGICYSTNNQDNKYFKINITTNNDTINRTLMQCMNIDLYNIGTDSWSILKIDTPSSSLSSHHLFKSINHFNKNILADLSEQSEASNTPEDIENEKTLSGFINLQLNQSKSIVSFNNLIYILNENCIHCYEFDSKQSELICLPYFRLPISNLDKYFLATAISAKSSKSNSFDQSMNLFSWYSNSEEDDFNRNDNDSNPADVNKIKKEVLIYLFSPQQSILYEFYPARNKLRKLPYLSLKHTHNNDSFILNIKSKLYVTGGILKNNNGIIISTSAIEMFDEETNSWNVYMEKIDQSSPYTSLILNMPTSNVTVEASTSQNHRQSQSTQIINQIIPMSIDSVETPLFGPTRPQVSYNLNNTLNPHLNVYVKNCQGHNHKCNNYHNNVRFCFAYNRIALHIIFSFCNLLILLPHLKLILWYRQGDLDPKFRKLIYYNTIVIIILCILLNILIFS